MAKAVLWSLDRIKDGLERFHKEHGHYPTSTEFDDYEHLPRAKTAERRFGGLIALRKQLQLVGTDSDLRRGAHSRRRVQTITTRAHTTESEVYTYLSKQFGKEFVHREFFFHDDKRTRADFFVYDQVKGFCVDVFYPSTLRNLSGCLNSKLKKYTGESMREYPVIYLQMNPELGEREIREHIAKKKIQPPMGQSVMSLTEFKMFCIGRNRLKVQTA